MTNEECYRLSHPQRRIWYTEVIHSDKGICNLRFLFKLHRKMNYSKLNQVVNRVISENDGLCIRLKENGHQEPKQYFIKHEEQEFEFLISVMWRIQICLRNGLSRKQKTRLHYLIQIYTISL